MEQPLVSLCIIAGNVENYIERCLTSFAPMADEIVIVRAIGNLAADKTIEIAEEVLDRINKMDRMEESGNSVNSVHSVQKISFRWADYKNAPANQSWPHLDDFAAARNLSFDMATGKYCFWVDTDDILGKPEKDNSEMAEIIRQHARDAEFPVYMFPYNIFGRGITINRERMIRKDYARWTFPVHECIEAPPGTQAAQDDRVTIYHMPETTKQGSNNRNLRILEAVPEAEMTPGLLYHLHGELLGIGDKDRSIETAKKALAMPGLGRPEKYELLLNLGKLAENAEIAKTIFHQAYQADPGRREALGLLTGRTLDNGEPEDALAYAHAMMGIPRPEKANWNDRPAAYDWLGVEIYTQALRANGKSQAANRYRTEVLKHAAKTGPIISLIHATRGRPKQAAIARKVWHDLADRPDALEHIFVFDEDDEASRVLLRFNSRMVPAGGGCVNAWNMGAFNCAGEIIIQLSDDWMPPARWDALILEKFSGDTINQPHALAVSDGHRTDDLLCMAICTREYFLRDYFLFHPRFTGVYSDNYFSWLAYRRGAVIEARDLVFDHNHPFFNKDLLPGVEHHKMDATYAAQNSPARYAEGMAIYNELMEGNDWSTVPGYCNFWAFYQQVAKTLKDGDVVAEIGVWLGRSIIMMAQECKRLGKKVKLYAIDNFKGESDQREHQDAIATLKSRGSTLRQAFEYNIARCGVAGMIEILDGDSCRVATAVAPESLSFCFIDGAHDQGSVQRDISAWLPKMKKGHAIAGHDAHYAPVVKAVKERFGDKFDVIGPVWMAKA